jgi:hypothetical protein
MNEARRLLIAVDIGSSERVAEELVSTIAENREDSGWCRWRLRADVG